MADNTFDYYAPPTIRQFMHSNKRVRLVRGPVGSGKSSGMVMELLRRAQEQPPDPKDGKRRSRTAIVRNTLPQLETTCLKTIQELIRPIIDYRVADHTIWIKQGDMEAEWILLPLDRPENVKRLLSLDLTNAWLSEFRELPVQILLDVLSRCGRFPSKSRAGTNWYGVIGETNSFDEDSDWNKVLEEKWLIDKPLPDTWGYFIQPGAREPNAENRENLQVSYYEDLIQNNSAAWVEQYVDNIVAPSLSGEAVFRSSFKSHWHVTAQPTQVIPGQMLIIGMDFGRNPAAVIGQMDPKGRIVAHDECVGENMGVEKFVTEILRPMLYTPKYARLPTAVVGDPSGIARAQIGEESVFQAMKRLGFAAQPAQTNNIDPRLRAVEKQLLASRDGGPALLISPACEKLVQAMRSKYRYAKKKDGELQPLPDKTHPWSDIADAFQYFVLGFSGTLLSRIMRPRRDRNLPGPVGSAGWT
jgi:hypothetical protein